MTNANVDTFGTNLNTNTLNRHLDIGSLSRCLSSLPLGTYTYRGVSFEVARLNRRKVVITDAVVDGCTRRQHLCTFNQGAMALYQAGR